MKKWWSTLIILTLAVMSIHFNQAIFPEPTAGQQPELSPDTLAFKARELKEKGIFTAPPRIVQVAYPPVRDYEELLSQSKLAVLATCTDFTYRLNQDGSDIETLYKFRITDALHGQWKSAPAGHRALPGAQRFGSLGSDEVLLIRAGGILRVDDVLFSTSYSGLPGFEPGREYVLFLKEFKPEKAQIGYYGGSDLKLYYPTAGPKGCFLLEADSTIQAVDRAAAELDQILEARFGRSKDSFVEHIRALSRRMNPDRGGG